MIEKYRHYITYFIVGVFTTLVSWAVYYLCYDLCGLSNTLSNVISWIAAVSFAYVTNKIYVFKSRSWEFDFVKKEAAKFAGARLASGLLETAVMYVLVDLLGWPGMVMKVLCSGFILVVNYIASKFLVFGDKNDNK